MKHSKWARTILSNAGLLIVLALTLGLAGCSLGQAVTPSPPTGVPADRSVGVVNPVPPPIPHSIEGRSECFSCHAIGAVDAPPVPSDHEQDVAVCDTCHAMWLAPAIVGAAPPAVQHEVEGRGDCLVCHKLGTADAPRVPDNHSGLTGEICLTCHTAEGEIAGVEEQEAETAEPPAIPHSLLGFEACSQCHAEGGPGIPRFPDDHIGRTDDLCTACHEPAQEDTEPTPPTETASTPTETPVSSTGDIANGQGIFAQGCAPCHGPEGEGTAIAPDALNDASLLSEFADDELADTIRMGIEGKMPASPQLSDQDVLDLIAFLRSW